MPARSKTVKFHNSNRLAVYKPYYYRLKFVFSLAGCNSEHSDSRLTHIRQLWSVGSTTGGKYVSIKQDQIRTGKINY